MKLDAYMKKAKLSDADLAARLGCHRTEVWNYRTGRRQPRADRVAAIEKATGRVVTSKDLAVRAA